MTATEFAQVTVNNTHNFMEPLFTKTFIVLIVLSLTFAVDNIKL